jgi:hypothetical protein
VSGNGVDLQPQVGAAGFAGTLAQHGYNPALIDKAPFSTKSTFQYLSVVEPEDIQGHSLHPLRASTKYATWPTASGLGIRHAVG